MFITKDIFRYLFRYTIDISEDNIRLLINMYNSCSWMKDCMTYDQLSFAKEWKKNAKPYIKKYFIDLENDKGECTKCGKKIKYSKLSKHQRNCKELDDYIKNGIDIELDYCKICKWRHPLVTHHYKYIDKKTMGCDLTRKKICRFCKCDIFVLITHRHEDKCKKRCECVLRKRLSRYDIQCNKREGIKETHYYEQCKVKKLDGSKFCRIHNVM